MLRWALFFFVLSLIAWLLGFYGLADVSATIAQVFLAVFLVLAVVFLMLGVGAARGLGGSGPAPGGV